MKVHRRAAYTCIAMVLTVSAIAEDKGRCPGVLVPGKVVSSNGKSLTQPKAPPPHEKPAVQAEYLGRVTIFSAVSDKGYVCDAAVRFGIDSKVDETVLTRFKQRHFQPIMQNGAAVPTNVIVNINVWRTLDGNILEFPEPKLPKL